jgi:hypothetical protein
LTANGELNTCGTREARCVLVRSSISKVIVKAGFDAMAETEWTERGRKTFLFVR